jgi:hypothetical protein
MRKMPGSCKQFAEICVSRNAINGRKINSEGMHEEGGMIAKLDWTSQASRHQGPRPTNGGYLEAVRLPLGQEQERALAGKSGTIVLLQQDITRFS